MNKKVLASPIQNAHWIQLNNNMDKSIQLGSISVLHTGSLDIEAISAYLTTLVERLDIIRTAYEVDEFGGLWQNIRDLDPIELVTEDWRGYTDAQIAQRKLENTIIGEKQSSDFTTPWLRLVIAQQSSSYWCCLEMSALNTDSFTLAHLMQLILAAGSECSNDAQTWLQNEVIQYEELAPWLADFLLDEELTEARQFWARDKSVAALVNKCTLQRYKHDGKSEYKFDYINLGDIQGEISRFAEQHQATSAEVVCASLRLALKKFAPKAELARMFDSRSDSDLADAIGPLSRAVPLFPEVADNFNDAIQNELECSEHGVDYAECFAKSHDHESAGFSFIFDSVVNLDLPTLQIEQVKHLTEACKLQFTYIQQESESRLQLTYDSEYVDAQAVTYLLNQIKVALTNHVGIVTQHLDATYQGYGKVVTTSGVTVLDHVNKVVAAGNGSVLELNGKEKTLADVDCAANQLANYLQHQGVGKGDVVALCLVRSVDFVIAMLATMKAGATYVPIDIDLPHQRITDMLKDAQASTVISVGEYEVTGCKNIDLNELKLEQYAATAPDIIIQETDLAYILFTSGSTGKAKGVSISHKALLNHMNWINDEFTFAKDDRFLQRTSASFDASIWEFWAPLMVGATMVIAPSEINYDLPLFKRTMHDYSITRLQLVPSLLDLLLEHIDGSVSFALKSVFCGGEALKSSTADKTMQAFNCEVINLYGPSECCIDALFWRYERATATDFVPIGYPIDNLQCRVMKEDGCLAEIGETGELQIAGDSVFNGYFGQDALTAKALIHCNTSHLDFYKTGDHVQVLSDGNLMYLERLDNQVKLNGFRIEPDEVSMIILNAGLAEQAKCVVAGGGLSLFIIAPTASEAELTQLLANKLPEYMQPKQLIELEAFPYLSNGKLDTKTLIESALNHTNSDYVKPETEVEVQLAHIWQELLNTSMLIGTTHDFFAIGGHSLLAMKVLNRIQEEFKINISVRVLFQNKTIAELAAHIEPLLLLNSANNEELECMEGGLL
ncbi:amino acid adenylation domain-containing protein [Pseudoalteromonas sp. OANN1]|uniref:non-ribosomal peptide synthetase n=1 Tax=Pseudoalteromonas sp. OANN1 TaxID=2954497 RepID=UPI002097FF35|nr:amino acid adenylation domain-containing protein [Pseudoalteromonas sp. OANN1]MCO7200362.1 amino acid adenylation domain-containing protein [Pseudoalteromonas sp. OANN1]